MDRSSIIGKRKTSRGRCSMACDMNIQDVRKPRIVILGLASCFGCQLQITNAEECLMDVLGQVDLEYWQLASSAPEPEGPVDVVVIEGAVTTEESLSIVRRWRERASKVIAIGACAATAGIPGMAAGSYDEGKSTVYANGLPEACGEASPLAVFRRSFPSIARCAAVLSIHTISCRHWSAFCMARMPRV